MSSENLEILLIHGTRFPPFRWLHKLLRWRSNRQALTDERRTAEEFHWTDLQVDNSFASKLREKYPTIKIISWEGWNSAKAREQGADTLHERLQSRPEIDKIIVAHSHGGNVAMRALQRMDTQRYVLGVACLGTPFLQLLPRDPHAIVWLRQIRMVAIQIVRSMSMFVAFGFFVSGLILLITMISRPIEGVSPQLAALIVLAGGTVLGAIWMLSRRFPIREDAEAERKLHDTQVELLHDWLKPIEPSCLCVHPTGDEAAGWLSFWSAVSNMPYVLRHHIVSAPLIFVLTVILFWFCTLDFFWDEGGDNAIRVGFAIVLAIAVACILYWAFTKAILWLASLLNWLPVTFGLSLHDQLIVRTVVSLVPLLARQPEFKTKPAKTLLRHAIYDNLEVRKDVMRWIDQLIAQRDESRSFRRRLVKFKSRYPLFHQITGRNS